MGIKALFDILKMTIAAEVKSAEGVINLVGIVLLTTFILAMAIASPITQIFQMFVLKESPAKSPIGAVQGMTWITGSTFLCMLLLFWDRARREKIKSKSRLTVAPVHHVTNPIQTGKHDTTFH